MMTIPKKYTKEETSSGFVFSFYCDLCKHSVVSPVLTEDSPDTAWDAAQKKFNMCHKCGKWVCDTHYNEEEMTCIECTPKKMYCSECGSEIFIGEMPVSYTHLDVYKRQKKKRWFGI